MRILVVGAGATGGYFGGRLLEAGADVTFLVRPGSAYRVASAGLSIRSPFGDVWLSRPPTVIAEHLYEVFDVVLVTCKAYDLDAAIRGFEPALGRDTAIIPLTNGMRHLDTLDRRFGRRRVFGGQCLVSVTRRASGEIVHLNDMHQLSFGERDARMSSRVRQIADAMSAAKFDTCVTESIVQQMWEKWIFLATLASATCLMRSSIGDIRAAPGGSELIERALHEAVAIAESSGHAPRGASLERIRAILSEDGSPLAASMLRDIENRAWLEADHVIGDLIRRGVAAGLPLERSSVLRLAYTQLQAYEARRARESAQGDTTAPATPSASQHRSVRRENQVNNGASYA
jgi:2-dehydropantoate 2-reductase